MSGHSNGNLSHSMRENYTEHGVDQYYLKVGHSYRNPHFEGVKACVLSWMNRWYKRHYRIRAIHETSRPNPVIFDMACGTGEVTLGLKQWHSKMLEVLDQLQSEKRQQNAQEETPGSTPRLVFPEGLTILAADPYTSAAYRDRTGTPCTALSFQDIADGALPALPGQELPDRNTPPSSEPPPETETQDNLNSCASEDDRNSIPTNSGIEQVPSSEGTTMDMVICSFALHLITPSELFALLWQLSTKATWLIIIAPHKKPEIKDGWGWVKWNMETWSECGMNETMGEILEQRVHCRVYKSLNCPE